MLLLQASIGAVNDIADARPDGVGKPAKPIPSGAISMFAARSWAGLTCLLGLALALPYGLGTTAVAALGVGLGYLYDVRLSRTALSWLPLALALPLVPTFAWLGATGAAPPGILALLPAGLLAGAALMMGNSLTDLERDAAAGKSTIAVRLGPATAWRLHAVAFAGAVVLAFVLAPSLASSARGGGGAGQLGAVLVMLRTVAVPVGAALIGVGVILVRAGPASIRERGWELEAVGTAVLGVGWLAGTAAVARVVGAL